MTTHGNVYVGSISLERRLPETVWVKEMNRENFDLLGFDSDLRAPRERHHTRHLQNHRRRTSEPKPAHPPPPPTTCSCTHLDAERGPSSAEDQETALSDVLSSLRALPWPIVAAFAGAETGVELADQLAERLGLPGNGMELSECRRNKYLMGERASDGGEKIRDPRRRMGPGKERPSEVERAGGRPGGFR